MKATLQYNDEEHNEAKMAVHAPNLYSTLFNAREDFVKLVNDRPDLAFTDDQDKAIRAVICEMSEMLDFLE